MIWLFGPALRTIDDRSVADLRDGEGEEIESVESRIG